MPIYEYQCTACGHHFDSIQSFKDKALVDCPACEEPTLKKLISASAFHLKGSGWYATDFKGSKNPAKPNTENKENGENAATHKAIEKDASKKELTADAKDSKSAKKSDKTNE